MNNIFNLSSAACGFADDVSSKPQHLFEATSHCCIREAASGGKENRTAHSCATPVSALSSRKNMGMPTTLFQWEACAAFESAALRLVQHPGSPTFFSNQIFIFTCLESRSVAGPGRTHPT
jgi:hypothetical protein